MKHRLVRRMLLKLTSQLPVYESGKAPIALPEKFVVFSQLPSERVLQQLIKAYQIVFAEPPWQEEWSAEKILRKLQGELTDHFFLVIMRGNEEWPVGGFSWGAIVPISKLEDRIEGALEIRPRGLGEALREQRVNKIVYFDEFAILRPFRKGLEPLRFLLRPGLELGWSYGVRQTLFWTTPKSKIVNLSLYLGYEPIFSFKKEEKEIIFLFQPDFTSILKMTQSVSARRAAKVMKIASGILGKAGE